jgi:hypothetical protein
MTLIRWRRLRLVPPAPRPDAHACAERIRSENGWGARCGEPGHVVDTPFRRANKWPPVDECKLRDLARRQLGEVTQ